MSKNELTNELKEMSESLIKTNKQKQKSEYLKNKFMRCETKKLKVLYFSFKDLLEDENTLTQKQLTRKVFDLAMRALSDQEQSELTELIDMHKSAIEEISEEED